MNLSAVNAALKGMPPEDVIRWAVAEFGNRIALQASMQKTAGVLMHMVSLIAPEMEVIFVDTGVHFPETLALRDEFARRYGLNIRSYAPARSFDEQHDEFGRHLHLFDGAANSPGYQECCRLRKEEPFLRAVQGRFDAVIGGLMREEGGAREFIATVSEDSRISGYKVYPLAFWDKSAVDSYTVRHGLPVHPLYVQGYASIGCHTCTTPVMPGESKRAGRWRHIHEANPALADKPLYCGINLEDRKTS